MAGVRNEFKIPVCVKVSAVDGGHLTLPENLFITDAEPGKMNTVPSMCFLIEHAAPKETGKSTRLLLDLGLKRDLKAYMPAMYDHISKRQPIISFPDTAENLRRNGLDPAKDIDVVMYTHVHWDHVGTPDDYPNSKFVVGSGTLHLLENGAPPHYPAAMFDSKMLNPDCTVELPPVRAEDEKLAVKGKQTSHEWKSLFGLPAVLDYFGDGSTLVVDCPGHLRGHINLLLRTAPEEWIYLGGDCCHDIRILEGSKDIALYDDGYGHSRSVHMDTDTAKDTITMIQAFLKDGFEKSGVNATVEAVVAHDKGWRDRNGHRFYPNTM